jgi:hypothetical protein
VYEHGSACAPDKVLGGFDGKCVAAGEVEPYSAEDEGPEPDFAVFRHETGTQERRAYRVRSATARRATFHALTLTPPPLGAAAC